MRAAAAREVFSNAALWTARQCGRASTFGLACLMVVAWAAAGPVFRFSDTWQLVINTGTTIVTFLMVFLLQHAQNRDAEAIQVKLDELIRLCGEARGGAPARDALADHPAEPRDYRSVAPAAPPAITPARPADDGPRVAGPRPGR